MNWLETLGLALALLLVLEGLLPLLAPGCGGSFLPSCCSSGMDSCAFADCSVSQQAPSC